jgi:iron complex outermembrane receptor protein
MRLLKMATLVSAALIITARGAYAQEPAPSEGLLLSPIVVTAEKRKQDLQNVPASITSIDSTQIEDNQITTMKDVFKMAPNIYITKTGPSAVSASFATMRGIASSMGNSPVLGVYIDDVYYPYLDMTLLDVERVEILRGPQGTLYGRNTEAGVINIITKDPGEVWRNKITSSYSSYNTRQLTAASSGPLVPEKAYFLVAASYLASDSYFKNRYSNDDSVNKYENYDGRMKLISTPSDRLKFTLSFDVQNYWSGGYADFAPLDSANPRKNVNMDYDGSTSKNSYITSLKAEYETDFANFYSMTSYNRPDRKQEDGLDGHGGPGRQARRPWFPVCDAEIYPGNGLYQKHAGSDP